MLECGLHPLEGSSPLLSDVGFDYVAVIRRYDEAKTSMKKHGVIVKDVSFDLKAIMKAKDKAVRMHWRVDCRCVA